MMTVLLPAAASAAEPRPADPEPLAWHCVQEFDAAFHVLCMPRGSGAGRAGVITPAKSPDAAAGAAADMRPVAQRGDAEVFSTSAWRVPLHSTPSDGTFVEALLKSVLCGRHPSCSVGYEKTKLRIAGR